MLGLQGAKGCISRRLKLNRKIAKTIGHRYTVKPALSDHPMVQEKVVVIDRWSLKQGSLNSGRFFEALLSGGERRGTHAYDQRNDKSRHPGASGGLVWGSLANLCCGGCFKRECWVKARIFLAFGRLRQGKSGRWCKNSGSLVALRRWSPNTGHFEWQTLRA